MNHMSQSCDIDPNTYKLRSGRDGDYFRLLVPGTYKLSASHSGYERREISVTVTNGDSNGAQGLYSVQSCFSCFLLQYEAGASRA